MLAFFAHPDDETLGGGGLVASAVRAGRHVTVVNANRGEKGEVIPADLAHLEGDDHALAGERARELDRAIAALKPAEHLMLDAVEGLGDLRPPRFTDSGMQWIRPGLAGPGEDAGADAFTAVDLDVSARLLAAVIRSRRPEVLLTEEPDGGYGHPDHIRVHDVAMRAAELAADEARAAASVGADAADDPLAGLEPFQVPMIAWVTTNAEKMRTALAWMEQRAARSPILGERGDELTPRPSTGPLVSRAYPPERIDLDVDLAPVLDSLTAAMRAHRTQVQAVHLLDDAERDSASRSGAELAGWFAVSNGILQPIMAAASVTLAPGQAATTGQLCSFFAHD